MKNTITTIILLSSLSQFLQAQFIELGGKSSLKINGAVLALNSDKNGNVYAAGEFTNNQSRCYVVKFDGSKWTELQSAGQVLFAKDKINTIGIDNNNIYVGGDYKDILLGKYFMINFYNGTIWQEMPGVNDLNLNGKISHILPDNKGNIYVCGAFRNASKYLFILKYDGNKWIELGGSNSFYKDAIMSNHPTEMAIDNQNNLYVTSVVENSDSNIFVIKKFNGISWSNIRIPIAVAPCQPYTIATDSKSNLYISGCGNHSYYNYVYKFNGLKWEKLGGQSAPRCNGPIKKIVCDKNDNIYATITDSIQQYYIAKFDGTKWTNWRVPSKTSTNLGLTTVHATSKSDVITAGEINNDNSELYVAKLSNETSNVNIATSQKNYISPNPCNKCELITNDNISAEELVVIDLLGRSYDVQIEKSNRGYSVETHSNSEIGIYFLMNKKTGETIRFLRN